MQLWFPILKVFTGLLLSKNEQVRNDALSAFEKTLEEHHAHFSQLLWQEIFAQVLLPAMNAVKSEIENTTSLKSSKLNEFYVSTLHRLLVSMNRLFTEKVNKEPNMLLTWYSDCLCLFISNLSTTDLAVVAINNLRSLLLAVGESDSAAERWGDLVEQLSLLFQATQPKLLLIAMQNFQSQEPSEIMSRPFSDQLPVDGFEQCYAKCTSQLLLTQTLAEVVERSFQDL